MERLTEFGKRLTGRGTLRTVVVLAIVSVFLKELPWLSWLFRPFRTFDFFLHELGHALTCLATAGTVKWIKLGAGGITDCSGGNAIAIGQAGYLGQALLGSVLILVAGRKNASNFILLCIGVAIGLVNLFFLKDRMSITWAFFLGATLVFAGLRISRSWAHFIVLFLAVQTVLYVFGDVELVLEHSLGLLPQIPESDATHMARLTGTPPLLWSVVWCFASTLMLVLALYLSTRLSSRQTTELPLESKPASLEG